jgi:nitrous oxidase accessory protein NosD
MNIKKWVLFLVSCALSQTALTQDLPLTAGMVIRQSVTIQSGTYTLKGHEKDLFLDTTGGTRCTPVIRIEGDHIEVDFQRAQLVGTTAPDRPDLFAGVAIVVKGNDVILRNARISGYKVAILAENCTDLRLIDCEVSYNYRPRLHSGRKAEDARDWLSYHHNERDEWLRYGAGIYLKNCPNVEVQGCKAKGNQNALLMVGCNEATVWNNFFQFNSGLGVGMYRCSNNRIMHNKLDWNVRGYSHGFYQRGQDSAGILLYEQSSNNLIAYNSATHSGDGLFLWAGQTTMDTGRGGCNDNLIFGNDFSHAPTNGIEVTFSRNTIRGNMLRECTYGVWGGYSFGSIIMGNLISECKTGVAIEHGQDNAIVQNLFLDNQSGLRLWANEKQPDDWGYPKNRDTRSKNTKIDRNVFLNNAKALRISASDSVQVNGENLFLGFDQLLEAQRPNRHLRFLRNEVYADSSRWSSIWADTEIAAARPLNFTHAGAPQDPYHPLEIAVSELKEPDSLKGGMVAALPADFPRGRQFILVDAWGPYDFRRPVAALDTVSNSLIMSTLLGPAGDWKVVSKTGVKNISAEKGTVPAVLAIEREGDNKPVYIRFEYSGPEVVLDVFGRKIQPGDKYFFELTLNE